METGWPGLMIRCVLGIITFGFLMLVEEASACLSTSVVRHTSKLSGGGRVCQELHRICCVALTISAGFLQMHTGK